MCSIPVIFLKQPIQACREPTSLLFQSWSHSRATGLDRLPKKSSESKPTRMLLTGLTAQLPSLWFCWAFFAINQQPQCWHLGGCPQALWNPAGSPWHWTQACCPMQRWTELRHPCPGSLKTLPSLVLLSGFRHFLLWFRKWKLLRFLSNKTALSPPASGDGLSQWFDPSSILGLSLPFFPSFLDGALGVVPILPGIS